MRRELGAARIKDRMTLTKRLRVGVVSLVVAAFFTSTAVVAAPKALSDLDASAYASAFQALEQGDFIGAQLQAADIQDQSLSGYLSFRTLMHPSAHKATFDELYAWLSRFRDLPLADKVFSLASKRKPADAPSAPMPEVVTEDATRSEITRPAREAFYSGDARKAFELAVSVGERWVAGLSAWRLQDYDQAHDYFTQIARDTDEDPWSRAAGAYWAARASVVLGDESSARDFLRMAARSPQTFYGMIAERQVHLTTAEANQGQLILAAYRAPTPDQSDVLTRFVALDPRAHRAAALAQIDQIEAARQELRAGLALSRTALEREAWTALLTTLGPASGPGLQTSVNLTPGDYPFPTLEPLNGFTVDRALVYAIVRQESAFNPNAVSHAGALGLMQLLPASAALATGDKSFRSRPKKLFNPAINLRAGQDYLAYLMDRGVGPDILRTVAAYNAGPGAVLKTIDMVGEHDLLLLIESLPALETRNYVERVMTAYWTYKRMFGEETHTLDALASGARRIDAHLDLARPAGIEPQAAPQALQVDALTERETSTLD